MDEGWRGEEWKKGWRYGKMEDARMKDGKRGEGIKRWKDGEMGG